MQQQMPIKKGRDFSTNLSRRRFFATGGAPFVGQVSPMVVHRQCSRYAKEENGEMNLARLQYKMFGSKKIFLNPQRFRLVLQYALGGATNSAIKIGINRQHYGGRGFVHKLEIDDFVFMTVSRAQFVVV